MKILCNIILKHCDRIDFSANTYAKTRIAFDNLDELLEYDNFKSRRIVSLTLTGYKKYDRSISVRIDDLGLFPFANYGTTVQCSYKLPSVDEEAIFKSDFSNWYQKCVPPYWLLGKFSLFGLLTIPSMFIMFIKLVYGSKTDVDLSSLSVLQSLVISTLVGLGIVYCVRAFDTYFWKNLFPAIVFNWGEEEKRNEKWRRYRNNIFWGILVALLLGLFTNFLYDTITH